MRKHRITKIAALGAATTVLAIAGMGAATAADTVSTAANCKPVFAHSEYKYVPDTNGAASTYWAQTGYQQTIKVDGINYHRDGNKTRWIDAVTCSVNLPSFTANPDGSVTIPYVPGVNTMLYGVNGYPENSASNPITHDVTIHGSLEGEFGSAPQFWIGYTAQAGYVIANPGTAPTHVDFYVGDNELNDVPFIG